MQNFENINEEMLRRNNPNNMHNLSNMNDVGNMNRNMANYSNAVQGTNPVTKAKAFQLVYPDIYYKLQPYIMMVCDQMDAYNAPIPTQEMIENMTDSIFDDVVRMFPDVAEYVREYEKQMPSNTTEENIAPVQIDLTRRGDRDRDRDRRDPRFRRRGLFRDLIDILFLTELLRRRRR